MREIGIDTGATGLDPVNGDRIVKIGAVELLNHSLAGQTFLRYLNPERAMPVDALAVHGLTAEFLVDKPLFGAVADEFLAFVADAPLIAHMTAGPSENEIADTIKVVRSEGKADKT
jgi:DNA polymerase III subunit epsilon